MISAAILLDQARAATGLTDFGDDWFMEPLDKLIDCVNAEAGLIAPDAGAGMRIQSALADRLQLIQYFKDHPAAREEEIDVAAAIIGLPRTGSTILHRLLASSPRLTSLYWWETAFPLPFPGESPGNPTPRQAAAKGFVDQLLNDWPDFESIDPMDAMAVNEEVVILDRTFLSTTYDSMMPIPSYGIWQAEQDHEPAYNDLYAWMQAIQHQSPWRRGRKWILKTPHHMLGGMAGLLSVWPSVKLIWTHRDIADVIPSYCSMCASMSVGSSTSYRRESQGAYWTARFRSGIQKFLAIIDTLDEGQLINIRYADTVSDPIGTAAHVMAALGYSCDDADRAAFAACMAENARAVRPAHKYSAADFGLTADGIASDFAFYHGSYS